MYFMVLNLVHDVRDYRLLHLRMCDLCISLMNIVRYTKTLTRIASGDDGTGSAMKSIIISCNCAYLNSVRFFHFCYFFLIHCETDRLRWLTIYLNSIRCSLNSLNFNKLVKAHSMVDDDDDNDHCLHNARPSKY